MVYWYSTKMAVTQEDCIIALGYDWPDVKTKLLSVLSDVDVMETILACKKLVLEIREDNSQRDILNGNMQENMQPVQEYHEETRQWGIHYESVRVKTRMLRVLQMNLFKRIGEDKKAYWVSKDIEQHDEDAAAEAAEDAAFEEERRIAEREYLDEIIISTNIRRQLTVVTDVIPNILSFAFVDPVM